MTTNEFFDLVAPIAICGGADVMFHDKAIAAWKKLREMPVKDQVIWKLPDIDSIEDEEDFDTVYHQFALDTYNALFEQIVGEHGPPGLVKRYDYWGAKGYKFEDRPANTFEFTGDAPGKYPWYETADLLIKRLKEIKTDGY